MTVVLAGGLMFFFTMFATLKMIHFDGVKLAAAEPLAADDNPSWKFRNPEFDQFKDWETRLTAENREISTVTQTVTKLQNDFDQRVLQFKDQEAANAKKQIKVIADMSPEGAAAMLNQLSDDDATKLLYLMRPDISGPILDAMCKLGTSQARRAALITERLKEVLPNSATNSLSSNASP
jgi:flagellar motility protein MotE (MotC chaperone)